MTTLIRRSPNVRPHLEPLSVAASPRREPLSAFALFVVALLMGALAFASFLAANAFHRAAVESVSETAPLMMKLAVAGAEAQEAASPDVLRRFVADLVRLPHIASVKLTRDATAGAAEVVAHDDGGRREHRVALAAPVKGSNGVRAATLELEFVPAHAAVTGALWTAFGLVAATTLMLFAALYRWACRRLRPIAQVEENLLAYHSGTEQALELLSIQNVSSQVSMAWNSLISAIGEMQQELESHRCRAAVASSLSAPNAAQAALLESLPIGVLRIDDQDEVRYVNRAATALLRLRPAGEGQRTLAERLGNAALAHSLLGLRQSINTTGIDVRIAHGATDTVVRALPLAVEAATDELCLMIQDVSQLKEVERSRDEFLAHITHELRTPLTNIRAYTETLSDDFFDDEQTRRECYNVIMSETRRLSKLIENVLSVSQIEAGAARLARTPIRLDESIRAVVQEVQAAADGKSIDLVLKIPSKAPQVLGDKHRLHQVWTNLIGNAVKYTPNGGSVRIDVDPGESMVQVRISDTGIGIPPEYHEKVFEKFFRVSEAAVEAEEGTGLGLPIAREILRMHGGSIRVESTPGVGSTFIAELPAHRQSDESRRMEVPDGMHRGG